MTREKVRKLLPFPRIIVIHIEINCFLQMEYVQRYRLVYVQVCSKGSREHRLFITRFAYLILNLLILKYSNSNYDETTAQDKIFFLLYCIILILRCL